MGQNSQVPLFQGSMKVSSNWQNFCLTGLSVVSWTSLQIKPNLEPCFMDTHFILAAHYYRQLSLSLALAFSLHSTSFIRTLSRAPSVSILMGFDCIFFLCLTLQAQISTYKFSKLISIH